MTEGVDTTPRPGPPLAGIRVLEIGTGVAAAFCARQLRGFGALTTRVEVPPRSDGPDPLTDDERVFLTAGTVDVPFAGADLAALAADADLIVEDQPPGWLAAHGLDPERLTVDRPELTIISVTPFGQTGPRATWRSNAAVQFAAGGLMSLTGEPHREPLLTGGSQALMLGGLQAFAAATGILAGRRRHGWGDWVDLSMQEAAASMPELYAAMSEYELGRPVTRSGNSVRAVWGVYRCADGFAGVCCLERQAPAFLRLLGPEIAADPRFSDVLQRAENDDELLAHVMGFMYERTKDELTALSPVHRVPFGAVRTPAELLDDETFAERGFFDRVPDARVAAGEVLVPGRPFPGLGWATTPTEAAGSWATPRGEREAPLAGVRILDLTMMWAGPYATKLLAELGAEVIKIESPSAWDNIRTLVPQDPAIPDPWNSAYYFNEYNHSKRSLTLDLAQDAGRDLFLRFVADADVVIENYRADVMEKLGLTTDVLLAANPDLVSISMAGFGKTGALRDNVGFGPIIEMMSGLMSLTGYGDDDVPYKTGVSYGDPVGGLNAVAAVCLGLIQRDRTGGPVVVDLAQRETGATMAGPAFVAAGRGEDPVHWGNRHPVHAPQGCYRAADDPFGDDWVVISVRSDDEWDALCSLLDRDDLVGLGVDARRARHDELDDAIGAWTARLDADEAAAYCQDIGVAASRVTNTFAIHDDPQLVHRGFYVRVDNPKMRPYRQTGPTWRRVHGPPHRMRRSPWFGEDNEALLAEIGCTSGDLARLAEARVIATAPINPKIG